MEKGRDDDTGYGIVDAKSAVEMAENYKSVGMR
jgi:hypothetical protein